MDVKIKKKICALFIAVIAIMLMPVAASASSYGFKQGDYVELNGYKFRVLNPEIDYIFSEFYLENRAFDPDGSNLYNPSDSNNIAYYLNNTFLNNLGEIKKYIKINGWKAGVASNESSNIVNTKIGMLSQSEWVKYSVTQGGGFLPKPLNDFFLITRLSSDKTQYVARTGAISSILSYGKLAVRPSLYLDPGLYKRGQGTSLNPYKLTVEPTIVLSEIKDLVVLNITTNEVTLAWKNPTDPAFSHLNIYKDNVLFNKNFLDETLTFSKLYPSQKYTFTIKAVDKEGEETKGITIVVSTDDVPLIPEVNDLKVATKHDQVILSWLNPQSEFFNHVRIYRRLDLKKTASSENTIMDLFKPITVEAAESVDFKPMFETNGTYWNDLTVDSATTYSYKVTTVNIADAESEGTIVQITTSEEPVPKLEGDSYVKDENGDFLYTWTSPATGKVRVLIDGKEYKTVDASLKQILIKKADMKYDLFNNPKVTLVPISETGKEGTPTKPNEGGGSGGIGGAKMPFGPTDLLQSSMELLRVIAPILLITLALMLFRPIKNLIVKAVQNHRERKMYR